ncbi:hypothetical protein Z042_08790 [Chania multitudinisentens RB-25]|uniref:Hemolysin n=1 Tax=Chania multitudinisentens RB-25 TaxID=1441930 RepID=W0LCL2_9GAMM|nr:hypothetical protein Z042_08790 [Chania multitudinisentens RB-25]
MASVMKLLMPVSALVLVLFSFSVAAKVSQLSDEAVKKMIIQESIQAYPGNCPCPFNSARNGSRCGKRSAWSRAGGYTPICYKEEVTKEMINEWRESHNQ